MFENVKKVSMLGSKSTFSADFEFTFSKARVLILKPKNKPEKIRLFSDFHTL